MLIFSLKVFILATKKPGKTLGYTINADCLYAFFQIILWNLSNDCKKLHKKNYEKKL